MFEIAKKYFLQLQKSWDKKPKIEKDKIIIGCPICNEGKSKGRKQRFALINYNDFLIVNCFNCSYKKTFENFLKEYDFEKFNEYKKELKLIHFEELKEKKFSFDKKEKIKNKILNDLINSKGGENVKKQITFEGDENVNEKIRNYLRKRGFVNENDIIYKKARYAEKIIIKKGEKIERVVDFEEGGILFKFEKNGEEYGFQIRSLFKKRFYTFNEDLKYYNYYNAINKSKNIFVFESIFDLFSNDLNFESKVAILGLNFKIEYFKDKNVTICFDNPRFDNASKKQILNLCNKYKNLKFFIPPKGIIFKDFNELLQKTDKKFVTELILKNQYNYLKTKILLGKD